MSDVDDELLALVGNGSSSSRAGSPAAVRKRKRRRNTDADDDHDNDDNVAGSDLDAEGSEDDEDGGDADEPVNPFRLDGIYEDEEDRERLLDMPELEREAELASRRDLIVQRRQKADLRAMVRNQQMAGRKSSQKQSRPSSTAKKTRKLKKASAISASRRRRRRRADASEEESEEEEDDESEEEEEEEEEESDYETSRTRKTSGKPSGKAAQLQKLKKNRARAQRKRQGGGASDGEETSGGESESSYDAEEAEAVWRRKKERERVARGEPKREVKQTREEERRKMGWPWKCPTINEVNAARVRRDHFTRLVHRPDWMSHLRGKFARINYTQKDRATGRVQTSYRLVQIIDCREGEEYYEVSDQYTNAACDMAWGGERMKNIPLLFVSNSPVTQAEYDAWSDVVQQMDERKKQRSIPSLEATQDQADELEAFISRPFTEQDINDMLVKKKSAKEEFQNSQKRKQQRAAATAPSSNGRLGNGVSGGAPTASAVSNVYDEKMLGQMNEQHRRADRERIIEAERKNALAIKTAAQRLAASKQNTPTPGTPTKSATPQGPRSVHASPMIKPTITNSANVPGSLAVAAADIDIDLGDF